MVVKLAPQSQIHHIGIEPEAPLALDARVQVHGERHAIVQSVADCRIHGVFDAGVEQVDPPFDVT